VSRTFRGEGAFGDVAMLTGQPTFGKYEDSGFSISALRQSI
jgi:hypothetical protein